MQALAIGLHQCEPLLAAGEGDRADGVLRRQPSAKARQLRLVRPMAGGLFELAAVWFQHVHAAISGEGLEFRVGHHRQGVQPGVGDQGRRVRQRAFVVVLQDQRVGRWQVADSAIGHGARRGGRQRRFEVHPQQLLVFADDALFQRGSPTLGDHQVRVDAGFGQKVPYGVAAGVVPHRANQRAVRAERGEVARHVGGAAQALVAAFHLHDGNRRFLGNAIGAALDVTIQHHIANDQHAGSRNVGQ